MRLPIILLLTPIALQAQTPMPAILPLREQASVIDRVLEDRLDTVVPMLMRRERIDLWVIVAREYNEDPVIESMLPATWLSARRRTILLFFDRGGEAGVERLAVARYAVGDAFPAAWDPEEEPNQWKRLADLIAERNPRRIALNRSSAFAHADGMTDTEFDTLAAALPPAYRGRIVSAENLAVGWLETRTAQEMQLYPTICRIAHVIIAEGLSEQAIQPGVTTTADLEWWFRERVRALGLSTWFHPSVSVQRADAADSRSDFSTRPGETILLPGDLVHVDFGITYLRLNTDTQQHAYLLRPGEAEAPAGLRAALAAGNRLQDILTSQFQAGRTGNEMLSATRAQAIAEGLRPSIYTHPLGFHGHGAGPAIGMWDSQGGVPGTGDYPLHPNTAFSIELNTTASVPEWDQDVRIMLEEDAFFDGEQVGYIDGRQTELWVVPRGRE
jgi:Xaa-Pro aminopeptidase